MGVLLFDKTKLVSGIHRHHCNNSQLREILNIKYKDTANPHIYENVNAFFQKNNLGGLGMEEQRDRLN